MQDSVKLLPDQFVSTDNILETEDLFLIVQKLTIAILIGLLIGLEREHSKPEGEKTFAGVRTFPIISIFGFVSAFISSFTNIWIYVAAFIGFAGLVIASHIFAAQKGKIGGTSEISILVVFMLGSLVFWNFIILAAIIGVVVNLFLTLKFQFHSFVGKISEEDLYATLKLAIITVIVLPLLPDQTFGPLDVLNPKMIWLMVIFISGISFVGYLLIKFFGQNKGIPITGLMGGMVSSTAVTFSLSKRSRKNSNLSVNFAIGVILASTVMYPRILFVILILKPSLVNVLWLPLLIFTLVGAFISYLLLKNVSSAQKDEEIQMGNPFKLKSALIFGIIFAAVIFLSKAAQIYLGEGGIYAASAFAGITSVDAIVVSMAKLSGEWLPEKLATAAIIIASVSNTIVKAVIVFVLGAKEMRGTIILGLGIITFISILYLALMFLI